MSRPLTIASCRTLCAWSATGQELAGEELFACDGCGSEWVASEPWTPVDADGFVPDAVQAAVQDASQGVRRGRG